MQRQLLKQSLLDLHKTQLYFINIVQICIWMNLCVTGTTVTFTCIGFQSSHCAYIIMCMCS